MRGRSVLQPQHISSRKLGVAAVCWDGAFVLVSLLTGKYQKEFWQQTLVIELGAGIGLMGILLARLGAQVTLTDKQNVIPLIKENISRNMADGHLSARAVAFEWGKGQWQHIARAFGVPPPDIIVAADCVYQDQDGETPNTEDFVHACSLIAGEATICYIAFESRVQSLRLQFLQHANRRFKQVDLVPQSGVAEGFKAEHIEIFSLSSKI